MEAFLVQQAFREIKALSLSPSKKIQAGFLLGHSRGPRIYIEKIWPSNSGFKQAAKIYWQLEKTLGQEIVGFFLFPALNRAWPSILKPFACGKILMEINLKEDGSFSFNCSMIDFRHTFCLVPCPLLVESGGEE